MYRQTSFIDPKLANRHACLLLFQTGDQTIFYMLFKVLKQIVFETPLLQNLHG